MKLLLETTSGDDIVLNDWEGSLLQLGCSPNDDILLFGPGVGEHHVTLSMVGDVLKLVCSGNHHVLMNDKITHKADLAAGDSFYLDSHKISILTPEDSSAFAKVKVQSYDDIKKITSVINPRTASNGKGSHKRFWSYGLLILGLVIALAMPMMSAYDYAYKYLFASQGLPTDTVWTSGDLSSAHSIPEIGNDCQVCHEIPFVSVRDSACLTCHQDIPSHGTTNIHAQVGEDQRSCLSCHKEHNEPSTIIHNDNAFCSDCHATTDNWHENPMELAKVNDFSAAGHPDFDLRYLTPMQEGDTLVWNNVAHPRKDKVAESSNLIFPHDLHMDINKVDINNDDGDKRSMVCSDCHTLAQDGEHFIPISMDNSCRSCHALEFDTLAQGRELPHAEPELVLQKLTEYFALQFADPSLRAERKLDGRRLPDIASVSPSAVPNNCNGRIIDCARKAALLEAANQFERTGCVICHDISKDESLPAEKRWKVAPIRLQDDWYNARFDHTAHMVGDKSTMVAMCLTCHEA
ncbi:MAG: hypothetical protein P1U57_04165, partial [Oleibacter sp.]|nr:hypothetical protein [Thalassolituus sp.]